MRKALSVSVCRSKHLVRHGGVLGSLGEENRRRNERTGIEGQRLISFDLAAGDDPPISRKSA